MYNRRIPQPLNALGKAQQFQKVGQPRQAVTTITDFLSRRYNKLWTDDHETLMLEFVRLVVELRDSSSARSGLHHYGNITRAASPSSFERVLRFLITTAVAKCETLKARCAELTTTAAVGGEDEDEDDEDGTVDIDSDDAEMSVARSNRPEDLIMAMAGSTASTERSARDALNFAVKFAANSMILVLEQLRKMPTLRHAYYDLAGRAFAFLEKYRRKSECLRLCRSMQHHLKEFRQSAEDSDAGRMADFEQASLIGTLFAMLTHCAGLQLWNQAFRTAETIHDNFTSFGVGAAPHLMATYYDRLAAIFWVSGNRLFHAYAMFRRFIVAPKDDPDREALADRLLLAAMCIPYFQTDGDAETERLEGDAEKESNSRLAALLSFSSAPSRAALIAEIRAKDVASHAQASTRALFGVLESVSSRVHVAQAVAESIGDLFGEAPVSSGGAAAVSGASDGAAQAASIPKTGAGDLVIYAEPLAQQALLLQTRQLQHSYATMTRESFHATVAPLGMGKAAAEQLVVTATRARFINLRIDHREGVIRFSHADFTSDGMRSHVADLGRKMRAAVTLMAAQDATASASAVGSRVMDDPVSAAAAGLPLSSNAVRSKTFAAAKEAIVASPASARLRTVAAKDRRAAVQVEAMEKERMERRARMEEQEAKAAAIQKEREEKERLQMKRKEHEANRRARLAQLRSLVAELRDVGVDDAGEAINDRMTTAEIDAAITATSRRKNDVLSSKTKELSDTIESRIRRTDYLARAVRVQEAALRASGDESGASSSASMSKIQQVEEKRIAQLEAYVAEQREALNKLATTKNRRALFFRRQLARAAPAMPAIVEWVRSRREMEWIKGLKPVLAKAHELKRKQTLRSKQSAEMRKELEAKDKERRERAEQADMERREREAEAEARRQEQYAIKDARRDEREGRSRQGGWQRAGPSSRSEAPASNWRSREGASAGRSEGMMMGGRRPGGFSATTRLDDRPDHLRFNRGAGSDAGSRAPRGDWSRDGASRGNFARAAGAE